MCCASIGFQPFVAQVVSFSGVSRGGVVALFMKSRIDAGKAVLFISCEVSQSE